MDLEQFRFAVPANDNAFFVNAEELEELVDGADEGVLQGPLPPRFCRPLRSKENKERTGDSGQS